MDTKTKIKQAINSGDWDTICEWYESMFGEKISPPDVKHSGADILNALYEPAHKIVSLLGDNVLVTKEEDVSTEALDKVSDSVSFISSSEFNLPEDEDPTYSESMKKAARSSKRRPRDSYKPNLTKCSACGIEFDFYKEYPVGTLDSGSKIKCNRCRGSGS